MEAPPMWEVGMVAARALSSYPVTRLSCEKQSNSRFSPYGEQQLFYQSKNKQLNKGAFLFRFYGFGFREPAIKAQYKEQCIHLADALAYKGKIQNK